MPPNGIVGVIGPNGAGKTTLFKLIMGQEACDKGTFEVGETVKIAYVDQTHKDIDPAKTVYQVVSGGLETFRMGGRDMNARAYLSRICTHILAFEGDSKVFYFEGSYSEYEENKKKRMGDVEPHRVRYRKLME